MPPSLDTALARIRTGRTVFGATAVLLPHDAPGRIAWRDFERHLGWTATTGLVPALNMDTGFGPELSPAQRREVLAVARRVLGPSAPMIAAASCFGASGDPLAAYRESVRDVLDAGADPIVFPSQWLCAHRGADLAHAHALVLDGAPRAYAFELGAAFASFGRIYDLDEYARLLDVPVLLGAKHSSLDRALELERLALRDARRPDFRVLTGNDLAIDMVLYGSDYLLGLSTFDPEAFARRDAWLAAGDLRSLALGDALQALGAVAFREPVAAYKDSAAAYLRLTGRMGDITVHPRCPRRPAWEADLLAPLRDRIEAAKRA